jgi:transcriptional antiterminator RfaH
MPPSQLAWFCLRSQPKHEHIAAAHLRKRDDVAVFVPRVRFQRLTRRGKVWATEALFPSYLFARFDWDASLRQIYHSPGISGVVHFGSHWPVIPDATIAALRATIGEEDVHVISGELSEGDEVRIVGGSLHGLDAVISRVMPGAKRVAVLMNFLGGQRTVEVEISRVIKDANSREPILGAEKNGE